jgi:hypothetical protein
MVIKGIITLWVLSLGLTAPQVLSGFEKSPPPPPSASSATVDLSGTWNFQTSDHKEYGGCEVGTPYSGKLTITQKDAHHLNLVMESGPTVCSPPAVCSYRGVIKENEAKFFNTTVAEGQGGHLMNSIDLKIISNNSAAGEVRNIQQFLGGSMCQWVHKIQLSR